MLDLAKNNRKKETTNYLEARVAEQEKLSASRKAESPADTDQSKKLEDKHANYPREKEKGSNKETKTRIEPESDNIAECDKYYLHQGCKDIIINAIQYCKKGIIEISLSKAQDQDKVIFGVKDSK